jgi:hypothetical protein
MRLQAALVSAFLCSSALYADNTGGFIGIDSLRDSRVGQLDVQGVRVGMKIDSAFSHLQSKGFRPANRGPGSFHLSDGSSTRLIELKSAVVQGNSLVAQIQYWQNFLGHVDTNALHEQVIARYGTPNADIPWGSGRRLEYHDAPEPAGRMKAKASSLCRDEITRIKKVPQIEILRTANIATDTGQWVRDGDAKVREYCPSALSAFHQAVKSDFGPQLVIGVGTNILSVAESAHLSLSLSSRALREAAVHEVMIRERESRKNAPAPQVDL